MENNPKPVVWYREPYVWLLIALPASAVIAGFYTLYLAIISNDGLVTADYYKQGLAINEVLERDEAAREHALTSYLRMNPENGLIQMQLSSDTHYAPPTRITLFFTHPTRAGFDQSTVLEKVGEGDYQGKMPALGKPGHWRLRLEADNWRLLGQARLPDTTQVMMRASNS